MIKTSEHKPATCKLAYNSWDKQCAAVWFKPKSIPYHATFDKNGCRVFGINIVPSLAQRKAQMDKSMDIRKGWDKKCVNKWDGSKCNRWKIEAFLEWLRCMSWGCRKV